MAALTTPRSPERGLTLTEVTVVMVIGMLIMAGLVGFYLSSQGLWLDSSTQAITQREASLVASTIRDHVRQSSRADVTPAPDEQHQQLALFRRMDDPAPYYYFWWNPADSLIYCGSTIGGSGSGPMGVSRAQRLRFVRSNDAVRVDTRLLTANGDGVDMSAYAVFRK